ncbi:hypothetical protein QBC43DRAFT_298531 [Cladorrhinum sp. PSN259]|nr:hypothetical protein QBC43DRAFT_298531 [Cladorrhinum sp. PSN259]
MPGFEIDYTADLDCQDPFPIPTLADSIGQTVKKLIPMVEILKMGKSIALLCTDYQLLPTENQRLAVTTMLQEKMEANDFDSLTAWLWQKIVLPQFNWTTSLSSITKMAEYKRMEEVARGLQVLYEQPNITPNNAKYVLERQPHMESLILAVRRWHQTLNLIVRKEARLEAEAMNPVERHACADIIAIAEANLLTARQTLPPTERNLEAMHYVKSAVLGLKVRIQILDTEIFRQAGEKETDDASEGDFSGHDDDTGDPGASTKGKLSPHPSEPHYSGSAEGSNAKGKTVEESTTEPKKKKNKKKKNKSQSKKKANEANSGEPTAEQYQRLWDDVD